MKNKAVVKSDAAAAGRRVASRMKDVLELLGEDVVARRPGAHAGALRKSDAVPHPRLRRKPGGDRQRRAVPGALRRDGDRQRNRVLQHVRASPAAVLRQNPRGLFTQGQSDRAEQDSAHRQHVRAAPATAGTADAAGGRGRGERDFSARRRGHGRGAALLHDDARGGEAALRHRDQHYARRVPRRTKPRATSFCRWWRDRYKNRRQAATFRRLERRPGTVPRQDGRRGACRARKRRWLAGCWSRRERGLR